MPARDNTCSLPDRRRHRGAHPADDARFATRHHPALQRAASELSWLLSRGYPMRAALALVGDRHALDARQRKAVERSACSDAARAERTARRLDAAALRGRELWIDGLNVLTTVEAAFGGCPLLLGRDGSMRDMASVHGTWRRVVETSTAVGCVGTWLEAHAVGPVRWLVDRPVSNSGRLCALLREVAAEHAWCWSADACDDPDRELADAPPDVVVASADSGVLDRCGSWFPLARAVVAAAVAGARCIDLGDGDAHRPAPHAVDDPPREPRGDGAGDRDAAS